MKLKKAEKNAIILISSLLLVAIVTLLFFFDRSLDWNGIKIISCIIADWWTFFLIPSWAYIWLKLKNKDFARGCVVGAIFGKDGIILSVILAPYFGAKYYFRIKE